MGNHRGGDMVNDIFVYLGREGVWDLLGRERTLRVITGVIELARRQYHCSAYEALDEVADALGICVSCLTYRPDVRAGLCEPCRNRDWGSSEPPV